MAVSEAGTLHSLSTTSTILNDSDEPAESPGPQNPMEILRGSMRVPRYLTAYFVERKYLNMPCPEFRDELPMTEEQTLVFKDFHLKHIAIIDHLEQHSLEVQVLIPKRLVGEDVCGNFPVHVRFHGGGFCTGSPTFKPWFPLHVRNLALENNSITLMPRYRKIPECHGREILNDADIFWEWYQSPKFYSDLQGLVRDTSDQESKTRFRVGRNRLLVSGDSAGGFLATYSWLSQPYLCIKALYLQYPMVHAYTRHAGEPYRAKVVSEAEVQEFAELYCNHIMELKALGRLTPRTDSIPPEGMDMAYILSSAKKDVVMAGEKVKISYWKWWFREPDILDRLEDIANRHDVASSRPRATGHAQEIPPISQRSPGEGASFEGVGGTVEMSEFFLPTANHPRPSYCPPMFVTHGMADTNCPYEDTLEFVALVKRIFPDAAITLKLRAGQPHGFDYALHEWEVEQRWLLQLCMAIASAWVQRDTPEASVMKKCKEETSDQAGSPETAGGESLIQRKDEDDGPPAA